MVDESEAPEKEITGCGFARTAEHVLLVIYYCIEETQLERTHWQDQEAGQAQCL